MATHRTILTARLLLEHFGRTLFLEQTPRNGGELSLPGGKIEKSEFAKAALIREVREEIGVEIDRKLLELVHVLHRNTRTTTEIILFFRATQWVGELRVCEPQKFKAIHWFENDVLPSELVPAIRQAMKRYRKGRFYTEFPKTG